VTVHIPVEPLRAFARDLLVRVGLSPDHAAICADNLLYANLRGIDGHGVVRLPHYLDRLQRRSTVPEAVPEFHALAPAVGLIDAQHGMGQVAGYHAMEEALRMAGETGLAWVAVKNSGHFGAAGFYGQQAAAEGFATIVMANTDRIVVPFGGRQAFFGSNPIAFVLPGPEEPVTVDMATSAIPYGKVVLAKAEGKSIPADWGVDAEGHPTTEPDAVRALHHMAGPKGYGLAFVIELLTSFLTGSPFGPHIPAMYGEEEAHRQLSHTFVVVDTRRFLPLAQLRERIAQLRAELHAVPPANGFDQVLMPGEPEQLTAARRSKEGIPLDPANVEVLNDWADRLGLPASGRLPITSCARLFDQESCGATT